MKQNTSRVSLHSCTDGIVSDTKSNVRIEKDGNMAGTLSCVILNSMVKCQ